MRKSTSRKMKADRQVYARTAAARWRNASPVRLTDRSLYDLGRLMTEFRRLDDAERRVGRCCGMSKKPKREPSPLMELGAVHPELVVEGDPAATQWNVEKHVWQYAPSFGGKSIPSHDIKVATQPKKDESGNVTATVVEQWQAEKRPIEGECWTGWVSPETNAKRADLVANPEACVSASSSFEPFGLSAKNCDLSPANAANQVVQEAGLRITDTIPLFCPYPPKVPHATPPKLFYENTVPQDTVFRPKKSCGTRSGHDPVVKVGYMERVRFTDKHPWWDSEEAQQVEPVLTFMAPFETKRQTTQSRRAPFPRAEFVAEVNRRNWPPVVKASVIDYKYDSRRLWKDLSVPYKVVRQYTWRIESTLRRRHEKRMTVDTFHPICRETAPHERAE